MVFYKQIRFTWNDVTSLVRRVATIEAMWTKGPSLPNGIPDPRVAVRPTTFATSVLHKKYNYFYGNYIFLIEMTIWMTGQVRTLNPDSNPESG